MAKSDAVKGKRLGTVTALPERAGGEVRALPPAGPGLAVFLAVLLATAAGFLWFLSEHRPKPGWALLAVGLVALYFANRQLPGLRERSALRRARRDGRRLVKSVRHALKKQATWIGSEKTAKLEEAVATLDAALAQDDLVGIEFAQKKLDEAADNTLTRKPAGREYFEQIGGAILAALLIRAFFYEAFRIPTGSMIPTLLVGDHLFVNKFTYGLRVPFSLHKFFAQVPERGDIVVFDKPGDEKGDDIIKRVIGLPGDVVEVRDRKVAVNGEPFRAKVIESVQRNGDGDTDAVTSDGPFMEYEQFQEEVGDHSHIAMKAFGYSQSEARGNEGRWVVEPGHVFVMGDNRDNSQDSRFGQDRGGFGQVPIGHIKGRADVIWLSVGGPHGLRFGRMFSRLE